MGELTAASAQQSVPAYALHAGDRVLISRGRGHKNIAVRLTQLVHGWDGVGNFVAATCQPDSGETFTVGLPGERLIARIEAHTWFAAA